MPRTMDPQTAHEVVVDLHKRAFLGRLRQHGFEPQNEKEAAALLDLGMDLFLQHPDDQGEKSASAEFDYGQGPFAQAKQAYDEVMGGEEVAPGFPVKRASASLAAELPQLPSALVDSAYNAAYDLAQDPTVYNAAVVKRAMNEAVWADAQGESQPESDDAE